MTADELCWMPAARMVALFRRRKLSPVEVMRAVLARIERLNPALNAFVTLTAEQAMKDARAAERALRRAGARVGPLHGVPFSTKGLVATAGVRTTFGTPLYADHVPAEDAPMVERLKAAGAIQLGKTNTPTFGWIGTRAPGPTPATRSRCRRRRSTTSRRCAAASRACASRGAPIPASPASSTPR